MNYALYFLLPVICAISDDNIHYDVAEIPWEQKLGNHRAIVSVSKKADAVKAVIPWRRRDLSPENKNIVVYNATTEKQVNNVLISKINREYGEIIFQTENIGNYYVYYMPYTADTLPWGYKTNYLPPEDTSDPLWRESLPELLPEAKTIGFQARTEFDRFDPMEIIATANETNELIAKHKKSYLLFPEDREHPIKMTDDLPMLWIYKGVKDSFSGEAERDEYYTFQIGVYAAEKAINDIDIGFSDLKSINGDIIPSENFNCINKSGNDWLGNPITKIISIPKGKIGALWIGVQIPEAIPAGDYDGEIVISPKGESKSIIKLSLKVLSQVIADHGDNELWRHSRLRWLNSKIGIDDEIVAPYTPLKINGKTIECLGRKVTLSDNGLPNSILVEENEILASPISMNINNLSENKISLIKETSGTVIWESKSKNEKFEMECQTKMEFDGFVNFHIKLNALQDIDVDDIYLDIPIKREIATYMMGMGFKGGYRPKEWNWVWDEKLANNSIWIGDVDAGIHCKLKGKEDIWELYSLKADGIPKDWNNEGKGGCKVFEDENKVVLRAYSGERKIKAGENIDFCFSLLITPLKPLDNAHWNQRYYHAYVPIDTVKESGANIINVHHGNDINKNINYPFTTANKMAEYISEAHKNDIKVKIYYTIRELSNYTAEIWALRSLGTEIFVDGNGGGHSWLHEHLVDHYAPAWHHTFSDIETDAAIAQTGLSRWHNYYLEGLRWLIKNVGIDGLYLDGIGYDREIMKRVRKVMDRERKGCLIDFHSGNNFHPDYGLSNCATQYLEHFPYIDSLWFGEGFDYDESPDFWLVEVSGMPFGLYGEMLQNNGNPWRGMIYGMTNRLGWGGDPRNIWKIWDDFGIQDAKMIGYWKKSCPVKTDNNDVLATVYRKEGKSLISIASWAKETVSCRLIVDWKALGLDPDKVTISAPEIPNFQPSAKFGLSDTIPVEPAKGWLLIME
ncbi:TPA: hypothetical protein ENS27_13020 [bacterium]|nr:hypothetical protein [bacterium]